MSPVKANGPAGLCNVGSQLGRSRQPPGRTLGGCGRTRARPARRRRSNPATCAAVVRRFRPATLCAVRNRLTRSATVSPSPMSPAASGRRASRLFGPAISWTRGLAFWSRRPTCRSSRNFPRTFFAQRPLSVRERGKSGRGFAGFLRRVELATALPPSQRVRWCHDTRWRLPRGCQTMALSLSGVRTGVK